MSTIIGILCSIKTGPGVHASTGGRVFLGIGGREFRIDSIGDDFQVNSEIAYELGNVPEDVPVALRRKVKNSLQNDPRAGVTMDTETILRLPAYIRHEPIKENDDWNLSEINVKFYIQAGLYHHLSFAFFSNVNSLMLGNKFGKSVLLNPVFAL